MSNENLETLFQKFEEAQKLATMDLSGWNPKTVLGVAVQKKIAQEAVEGFVEKYKAAVTKTISVVFLEGAPERVAQVIMAHEDEPVVVVRGDDLYRTIADPIDKMMDSAHRRFGGTQVGRLIEELTEYARDNGIRSLPMPKLDLNDYNAAVPTFEDVVSVVRKAIRATSADDLNRIVMERAVLKSAIDTKATGEFLPVVVHSLTRDEVTKMAGDLFKGRPFAVVDLDELPEDDGAETFLERADAMISEKLTAIT